MQVKRNKEQINLKRSVHVTDINIKKKLLHNDNLNLRPKSAKIEILPFGLGVTQYIWQELIIEKYWKRLFGCF